MKNAMIILVAVLGLASCDVGMFEADAAPVTFTFEFVNFPANTASAFLAGGFDVSGWSTSAYPVTFTGGNSDVVTVTGQIQLDSILFRIVTAGWGAPVGIDAAVLQPNAWDDLDDDHAYDSADANWGMGNGAEIATPDGSGIAGTGDWVPDGSTKAVVIDALDGAGRATLSIDGVVYWE